ALVTLSSAALTFEGAQSLRLSWGSLLVLLAAVCWGFENNCTRKISSKDTFQIVTLKGLCSGAGSLLVGLALGETLPSAALCLLTLLLGFVAYGLSITFYIRAQSVIGAARTSACYAVAPFVGALLSLVFLREPLSRRYFAALALMLAGSALIAADALRAEPSGD
ncbi:MAG: DMT family transporter, partial [Eubacteriales bacterium]|nr:DMT family transporter [Eubacteriales bacterium]